MVGLKVAKRLGIKRLKVFGDSELVIKQIKGTYEVKNPSLATYKAIAQGLRKYCTSIECNVINQNENKLADSLDTLAPKSVLKKEKMTLRVEKQPGLIKGGLSPRRLLRTLLEGYDPRQVCWVKSVT